MSQKEKLVDEAGSLAKVLDQKTAIPQLDRDQLQQVKIAIATLNLERQKILATDWKNLDPEVRQKIASQLNKAISKSRYLLASLPGDPTSDPDV